MLKLQHWIFFLVNIIKSTQCLIPDGSQLNKYGPLGLINFEKNDSFIDWVRIPELSFERWSTQLKFWRTVRISIELLPKNEFYLRILF